MASLVGVWEGARVLVAPGVSVGVGGGSVGVSVGGRGVQVAMRCVGAGVALGSSVQVGTIPSQTSVGEGPGVSVGRGVLLGVGE